MRGRHAKVLPPGQSRSQKGVGATCCDSAIAPENKGGAGARFSRDSRGLWEKNIVPAAASTVAYSTELYTRKYTSTSY